jgi:GntR family transcriptional regulator/MocR family aminotransferase
LHVLAWLPPGIDEAALVAEAHAHGVGLQGMASAFAGPPPRGGLIFGYSTLDERRIDEGLARLADLSVWRARAA